MSQDAQQSISVFLDMLPNFPKGEKSRADLRDILRTEFENRVSDSVERVWDLPAVILQHKGEYLELLVEARQLYVAGYFYSCVAMCGIVGERLAKDALRAVVAVEKDGTLTRPTPKAFDQLERVDASGIVRFLKEAGILSDEAAKASADLGELRNKYAHARGKAAKQDAVEAIRLVQKLVDDTVSMFKDFEIREGNFVRKKKLG